MTRIKTAAAEFLRHKRIAVIGVSPSPGNHGGNVVYNRLRDRGYEVFAVNPNAAEVEGDPAYDDLDASPVVSRRWSLRPDPTRSRPKRSST